jgi:hypothetical protein
MNWNKKVIGTILFFSILRLFIASLLELGNDESYYWLYSQRLQWNYFDHPPLVAIGIRLFTLNLTLQEYEVFVRLGSIVACAFSTWFIYRTVSTISNQRAGWFSVILYNISFYAGIVAGILVMPDSPQLLCWTFCLWMIARLCKNDSDWKSWLGFGIGAGLCIMSKVHGVFLWFGFGLYIIFNQRNWLKKIQFYTSLLTTALLASPLLFWNIKYDFITWKFHSERVNITESIEEKDSFLTELLGQVLVNNPVNFLLMALALVAAYRSRRKNSPALISYNFIALPMAALFIIVSFFRDIWPHWTGPAFTSLIPAAAIWLEKKKFKQMVPGWLRLGIGAHFFFVIVWLLTVSFYPGTYGSKKPLELGKGDVTLDKFGWSEAGKEFIKFYHDEESQGRMPSGAPLVCSKWWGAHLEYYFSDEGNIPVLGLGQIGDLHQYAWLNEHRTPEANMLAAYCIISSIEIDEQQFTYHNYYEKMELVQTLTILRNGKPAKRFYVYRLTGWKGKKIPEITP